ATGVSTTRSAPYLFRRPSVTRKTPPARPTSSPRMRTRSSDDSAVSSAELMACAMFSSATPRGLPLLLDEVRCQLGEHPLEHVVRLGLGDRLGPGDRLLDALGCFGLQALLPRLGPCPGALEQPAHPHHGVELLPGGHLVVLPVAAGVIGGRVGAEPLGDRLDQARALSLARPLGVLPDRHEDGDDVVSVNPDPP